MPCKINVHARCCCVAITLLLSISLFAQKTVTGKIVSTADKQPVAGATIQVKGTKIATQSGADGFFTISSPKDINTLVITIVGFEPVQYPVAGRQNIGEVGLSISTTSLNDVVVTGYTAQKRKEITGSVSVVSMKDLKSIPAGTPEQALQGQAAGVNIITSGNPGDNSNIFIRGFTSFGGVNPLIVVDGVPSAPNDLSMLHDLSANDIESLQVLKDAQAAIYGARGSAGVILITTKKGKAGKSTISYDAYYGTQRPLTGNVWHNANTQQMADLYFLAAKNSNQLDSNGNVVSAQYGTGKTPRLPDYLIAGSKSGVLAGDPAANPALYNIDYNKGPIYQIVAANKTGTDWYHVVFKPAPIQSHTLSASGGGEKSTYLFSVNYFDQTGTLLNTGLKRYAARINTSFNVKNNIRIGENVYVFYKENPRITNNVEGNEVNTTGWLHPIIPVLDIKGGFAGNRGNELGNSGSPYADRVRAKDNKGYNWDVQGNVWAEVDLFRRFTVRTSFGGNLDNYAGFFHGFHSYERKENNASNSYGEYAGHGSNWTWTNTLSYNNVFAEKHALKILVGMESAQYAGRVVGGNRINYFSDDPNFLNLSTGSPSGQTNYSSSYITTLYSLLARIDYAFNDRVFLGLSGRRDQSSVLGPDNRTGYFGAVSAGWLISSEDFMKNIVWLSSLKIRGSYGALGSISNTPALNSFTTYAANSGGSYYDITGSSTNTALGFQYSTFGNLHGKWESDIITNFGIDATILKNKLDFTVEWYQKKINGLLFQDQAPAVVGGASLPFVNIGDMKNTGVDISVNYHPRINSDFAFNIGVNVTTYHNVIVRIPGTAGFFETAYTHNTGPQVRDATGQAVGAFFGYKIVGLYKDAADVAKSPKETDAAPGRYKYADVNGDGKIGADDRVFFGNPNPKFTYGINLGATFRQFDFSMILYGSYGNDVLNYTRYFQDFYPQFQNAKAAKLLTNSWLPTRTNTNIPIVENNSYFSTNAVINDAYMENGSFLRCKQVQIGFNFAPSLLKHVGIDRARVYVQAANLFTITKYTGLDPELTTYGSSTSDNRSFGVDWGNYPTGQKQYNVGVSLTF